MTLRPFRGAAYRRKRPITRQTFFVRSVFSASGSAYAVSGQYGPKVLAREIPLGEDEQELFPKTVCREIILEFLKVHLIPDPGKQTFLSNQLRKVELEAGTPNNVELMQDKFLWSLTETFTTRRREGKAPSKWKMLDVNVEDCFPNGGTGFNVVARVTSPNASNTKVGKWRTTSRHG